MYWRTIIVDSKRVQVGLSMNWLSIPTTREISELVIIRYNNLPIRLLYHYVSITLSLQSYIWALRSIRIFAGLDPNIIISFTRSITYFLFEKIISLLLRATSIPRKYNSGTRFFLSQTAQPRISSHQQFRSYHHLLAWCHQRRQAWQQLLYFFL